MPGGKRSWMLAAGALAIAAALSWAGAALWPARAVRPPEAPPRASPPVSEAPRAAAKQAERATPAVSTLHEQATSAYHARLFADEDGLVLITQAGFTTFLEGRPAEEHGVPLGPVAARHGADIVFWRAGALRAVSLSGDGERQLAVVPRLPQHLLASAERLAWIHTDARAGTSLEALSGGEVRSVHAAAERVSAAVLHRADVYWVSETHDGAWTIARVGLDGRPPRATAAQRGRPPSMLAVGPDGVYFYAGLRRGVRRLSFDLERETAVSNGAVCSPLAVSSRVVCAQVGGLFEIALASSAPRPLAAERSGPITAVAATMERAYWVAESGAERLLVRSAALSGP